MTLHRPLIVWLSLLISVSLLISTPILANGPSDEDATAAETSSTADNGNSEDTDSAANGESEDNELKEVTLRPMSATYRAEMDRGVSLRGKAVRELRQRDDGRWDYRFDVDSFIADIKESVILNYDGRNLRPDNYRYRLSGMMIRNRRATLDFDWDNRVVHDRERDRDNDMDGEVILDQLGSQLQLWIDLKAGKQEMDYMVARNNGSLRHYKFEVVGEETLESRNFGPVETVVLRRIRDEDSPRETTMWFVPEWDYLLVQLEQEEDGGADFRIYLEQADLHDQRIRPD